MAVAALPFFSRDTVVPRVWRGRSSAVIRPFCNCDTLLMSCPLTDFPFANGRLCGDRTVAMFILIINKCECKGDNANNG